MKKLLVLGLEVGSRIRRTCLSKVVLKGGVSLDPICLQLNTFFRKISYIVTDVIQMVVLARRTILNRKFFVGSRISARMFLKGAVK